MQRLKFVGVTMSNHLTWTFRPLTDKQYLFLFDQVPTRVIKTISFTTVIQDSFCSSVVFQAHLPQGLVLNFYRTILTNMIMTRY